MFMTNESSTFLRQYELSINERIDWRGNIWSSVQENTRESKFFTIAAERWLHSFSRSFVLFSINSWCFTTLLSMCLSLSRRSRSLGLQPYSANGQTIFSNGHSLRCSSTSFRLIFFFPHELVHSRGNSGQLLHNIEWWHNSISAKEYFSPQYLHWYGRSLHSFVTWCNLFFRNKVWVLSL